MTPQVRRSVVVIGPCRRPRDLGVCARPGRRNHPDPADPHARRPLLEGHAGDDLEDDLRQGLDGHDTTAGRLHERTQEGAARRVAVRRPEPEPLRGGPPDLTRSRWRAPLEEEPLARAVWLVRARQWPGKAMRAQPVSVSSGRRDSAIALPMGATIVQGTDAGLLLISRSGDLELWRPGRAARTLGRLPGSLGGAGFASSTRLVAYGTGCRIKEATSGFPRTPVGYDVCRTLRVIDVVSGKRLSYSAPSGTVGWVPHGFGAENGLAPNNGRLAAEAAIPPARKGRIRVFVLPLADTHRAPRPAPLSTAPLYARTAWSPDGSWLFYPGPGERLRIFRPATGASFRSSLRCCPYTAMVAIPGDR